MNTESHADTLSLANLVNLRLIHLPFQDILGSATVQLAADATTVNTSVKKVAADVNAVKDSTGIEAVAITKGKISGVSATGVISFDLAGNQTNGVAATTYDVTATLASTSDLDPLVDAINAHAANTGISAVLGATAAEIILTHQTGETIELSH